MNEQNYAEIDYAQPETPFKGISHLEKFTQITCYDMESMCKPVDLCSYEQITRGIGCLGWFLQSSSQILEPQQGTHHYGNYGDS